MQWQCPGGTDPSRLQEHCDVLAELLLAVRAVGRAPHPFCKSVAEDVRVCPDDILPGGHTLLLAPCPEECTVPSPQGILQVFGLAIFTLVHDKMSVQRSSACSFPALHRTLSTEHQAQSLSNTCCILEKLFPTPGLQPVRCVIQGLMNQGFLCVTLY